MYGAGVDGRHGAGPQHQATATSVDVERAVAGVAGDRPAIGQRGGETRGSASAAHAPGGADTGNVVFTSPPSPSSAHSSGGEMGIRSMRTPTASSMAAARHAERDHAGLARTLDPEGLSGDGVSRWPTTGVGTSLRYGIRKSMKLALVRLPAPS